MRVLIITNLFPPHFIGGYEIMCGEVVSGLRRRGHEVVVLTSDHTKAGVPFTPEGDVHRNLHFSIQRKGRIERNNLLSLRRRTANEVAFLRRLRDELRPDIVYVWSLYGVTKYLLTQLQEWPEPVVFELGDEWLAENLTQGVDDDWFRFWKPKQSAGGRLFNVARGLIGRIVGSGGLRTEFVFTRTDNAVFVSRDLNDRYTDKGVTFKRPRVIYNGIPDYFFVPPVTDRGVSDRFRILYVGQVATHKGVITLVEALAQVHDRPASLTIVGAGDSSYVASLQRRLAELGLQGRIEFLGPHPRDALPGIYAQHDCLVFPSACRESFGLTVLEAMACGLVVIGTLTGGNREVMRHDVNCLTFAVGDAPELANAIRRVIDDPTLRQRLSLAGSATARGGSFTMASACLQRELFLQELCDFSHLP